MPRKERRVVISDTAYTYIETVKIFYHPEMNFKEMLDEIVCRYEEQNQMKQKLLQS